MADYSADAHESKLIDTHPTAYQTAYGEPQWNDVPWYGQDVDWEKSLKHITDDVFGITHEMPTKVKGGKEKHWVSKQEKKNTNMPTSNAFLRK